MYFLILFFIYFCFIYFMFGGLRGEDLAEKINIYFVYFIY